jgi:hypothetical protein
VLELWTVAALGLTVGFRHAFEPDHLAAVGALVGAEAARAATREPGDGRLPAGSEESGGAGARGEGADGAVGAARAALGLGVCWGLGHTAALLVVGGLLALLHVAMSAAVSAALELAVGGMLLWLGGRALVAALGAWRAGAARGLGPRALVHARAHLLREPHAALHAGPGRGARGWRSGAVGLVHGLAGSGALTALVLADLPDAPARLAYVLLFGLGSTAGMALVSGVAGLPLARALRKPSAALAISGATGALSAAVGLFWSARVLTAWAGA